MYFYETFPIRVISRPKLSGFGEHWGVQLPNGDVAHLTPLRGEEVVSFEEFKQGRPVREVRRVPQHQWEATMQRVSRSTRNPGQYRLFDRNCENYANWLTGEKPESPQVNGVAFIGLLALFVKLAS